MQDGYNLGWKLAYVVKGYAGPELLESYSAERAPVGKQIVMRANQSRLDYAPFKECFQFSNGVDTVEKLLAHVKAPTPQGVETRQKLQAALELKSYEFNAQGIELNQRYESSAVIPDPDQQEEIWKQDPILHVQPTTRPGAKIPHAWLVNKTGTRISTLDVVGKGDFTLVTGLAGRAWVDAANQLNQPYLKVVVTGESGTADPYCDWQRVREIHEAGALLVRPDGVVAWRSADAVWDAEHAAQALKQALNQVLSVNL